MKTLSVQGDMFAGGKGPGFAALVERRLGNSKEQIFRVSDVASVFNLGKKKILEMIECGRLPAVNLNKGMMVPVDRERPSLGTRPLLPLWRITYEAIMDLAKSMEGGV
jgi:ribosome biogenesis SPOUT family RNA methylase Rps3